MERHDECGSGERAQEHIKKKHLIPEIFRFFVLNLYFPVISTVVVAPTKSQVDMTFLSDFFSFFSHSHTHTHIIHLLMLERIFLLFPFHSLARRMVRLNG
jgi:hypothetical protein